jgi:hypothetical protein
MLTVAEGLKDCIRCERGHVTGITPLYYWVVRIGYHDGP